MRTSGAIKILVVGLVLLVLAVPDHLLSGIFSYFGAAEDRAMLYGAWGSTAFAAVGFVMLVAGLFQYFSSRQNDEYLRPYKEALDGLAAEYGHGVDADPKVGLVFTCARDGQEINVVVSPRTNEVRVASAIVARQPLAWVRTGATPIPPWREFRIVGSGRLWDLRAELPAIARALLEDSGLSEVMDVFFATPEGEWVLHRREGFEVRARVAPPARLERQVRNAVEIAFRVRRANG